MVLLGYDDASSQFRWQEAMSVVLLLQTYAHRIRELRRANADVPETALAPAFQQLLQGLIPRLPVAQGLSVSPEFLNPGVGRPDIALNRAGAPPRAFVELKAPAKSADPTRWRGADARQFERFKEFPCWATSNFIEIRLLYRDEEVDSATVVPTVASAPIAAMRAPTRRLPSTIRHRCCVCLSACAMPPDKSQARVTPRILRN